jgi:hypothetical protein
MRDSPLAAGDLQLPATAPLRWVETLLLTAAVPGLRFALGWADPWMCRGVFPWLSVVPLAVGVQHGLACALASALLLCAGASAEAFVGGTQVPSPELAVACCTMAAVAGRACDATRERGERLRRRVVQLESAIGRERASRHVLQLSHERLAQQLAGTPNSVLASVESAVERAKALRSVADFGRSVLELLAQHAELQGGCVFVAGEQGRVIGDAVAIFGGLPVASCGQSVLVTRALRSRRMVSVIDAGLPVGALGDERSGRDAWSEGVLAVLPLLAADASTLGVIAITRMPFAAFHPAALREAFVLVSRVVSAIEPETWRGWVDAFERGAVARESVPATSAAKWGDIS